MTKYVISSIEQFNNLYDKAKERANELLCIEIPTKSGKPVLVAKIQPRGTKGLVFAKIAPEIADQVKEKCDRVVIPNRHVRKFKIGKNEWAKFLSFLQGKSKYAPSYLVGKVVFTPGRGVPRPRTS